MEGEPIAVINPAEPKDVVGYVRGSHAMQTWNRRWTTP